MNQIRHFLIFALLMAISSCSSTGSTLKKLPIEKYDLSASRTVPFTVLTLKEKNDKSTHKVSVDELSEKFQTKPIRHEAHALEFTEQIKYWSYAAILLGGAGLASDSETKGPFSVLTTIGLIGSVVTPIYQQKQLEQISSKISKEISSQPTQKPANNEIELNNEDFYESNGL